MNVHLLIRQNPDFLAVTRQSAQQAYEEHFKHRVRAVNGTLVDAKPLAVFFEVNTEDDDDSPQQAAFNVPSLPNGLIHHVFVSYSQKTAMGACDVLALNLANAGFKVWFDQFFDSELNNEAMIQGVKNSKVFLLFLSKGVLTRPCCITETRVAIQEKKTILFVHEEDQRFGFAEFYEMRDEAPADLKHLFNQTESIPFRRRKFEADNMMAQLGRRIQKGI